MKKVGDGAGVNLQQVAGAGAVEEQRGPATKRAVDLEPEPKVKAELDGESKLRARYQVPVDRKRLSWTGSLDLLRDDSPAVKTSEFAAWWSVRDNQIVEDVTQLLGPRAEVEARLRALGFGNEGQQRPGELSLIKRSIDSEIPRRLPFIAPKMKPHTVLGAELAKLAEPVEMGAFERYVQRVSIRYGADGTPDDIYLLTYGWPQEGPGLNEDNIHWSRGGTIRHVLMNTDLEHTVALPMSVTMKLAMDRLKGQ